ncbi:hypothetical protein [Rhodopirellula sp. MGV]|uniref:hypothetical protein n=1 Tax=Rhodopirellula sp. MGV TaxID=2023130 RepID=UPI000B97A686|nr:hypothetical protein [Rhodopirellula sp. MGV]OYP37476.1 hypothetical protein CGZ80_04930 [Rhodopirellula sp. MGV]PNY37878.1 hypothetical protein C2E31_05065 [Rhodopirellula baltica]
MQVPILFLIFNRPSVTAEVFQQIRDVRPRQLFVAADGPRPWKPSDREQCQAAREITESVDWDCEVKRLYRDENLGCQENVHTAINWFFQYVDFGIILEDDCLPDPSFFRFCEELGIRYADDARIGVITGNNFQRGQSRGSASYYYSKYNHCWGWATWRRAWQAYDHALICPRGRVDADIIRDFAVGPMEVRYWQRIFKGCRRGRINSWAYRWTFSVWKNQLLTITPQKNLVQNIGFGSAATHTKGDDAGTPRRHPIAFPLVHPQELVQHAEADRFCAYHWFGIGNPIRMLWACVYGVSSMMRSVLRRFGIGCQGV